MFVEASCVPGIVLSVLLELAIYNLAAKLKFKSVYFQCVMSKLTQN